MATNSNLELSRRFSQMAAALELTGANPFRVNSDARVARVLKDMSEDIESYVDDDPAEAIKSLCSIDGIGKGSAQKIVEFFETARIEEHEELLAKVPAGLFDVLEIPGLGPKTVRLMWEQMGITSVEELKSHLDSDALLALPRMGAKTIANIRKAIEFRESSGSRVPLGIAYPLAVELVAALRQVKGAQQVEFAGSLRRGKETIGDIDILASGKDEEALREAFCSMDSVTQVLARGQTKCSVRLAQGGVHLQADLRLINADAWGAAYLYFSGSKEHNVRLRERAIARSMRLNEYGLFEGTDDRPQDAGAKPVAAKTEEAIYKALELRFVEPERREDHGELDADVPGLISLDDIKAELHSHTTASDGRMSIEESAGIAKSRGYHTLAVTDHSVSSVIANGLNVERLLAHCEAIRSCNSSMKGITVLAGSEVDILPDGSLDYPDAILAQLDVVVASPHVALRQEPKVATRRLIRAIENKYVHIIGHPTGRMLLSREGLHPDMRAVIQAAVEHGVALEINANWRRLDLRDAHVRSAVEAGCLIAIDTDAHRPTHYDYVRFGVMTARRGWCPADQCINTWSAAKLHKWLKTKRDRQG